MASYVWSFFSSGLYRRMASITVAGSCILCCISPNSACYGAEPQTFAREILNQAQDQNPDAVIERFDQFDESLLAAEDPLAEGRKFLQAFIDEINVQYGLALTIPEACKLVRANMHTLSLPVETENLVLATIALLEIDSSPEKERFKEAIASNTPTLGLWKWDFFRSKKKKGHRSDHLNCSKSARQTTSPLMEKDLPSNCYIGGCELLAGALVWILPIPGSSLLGLGMMGDGARRVIDGLAQLGDERRANPNYVPPDSPLSVNF